MISLSGLGPTDDVLCGLGGDDEFEPDGGNDVMIGGDGTDVVNLSQAGAAVDVDLAAGLGTVGPDELLIVEVEDVTGGAFDDTITGDSADNTLKEGEGKDTLDGGEGDDTLKGKDGKDTLKGKDNTDTLDGGDGDKDTCDGGPDHDDKHAPGCETKKHIP